MNIKRVLRERTNTLGNGTSSIVERMSARLQGGGCYVHPLPDIMGTVRPSDATRGASAKDTLSPTPPVECLSTVWPNFDRSSVSPVLVMAPVRCAVSLAVIPLM